MAVQGGDRRKRSTPSQLDSAPPVCHTVLLSSDTMKLSDADIKGLTVSELQVGGICSSCTAVGPKRVQRSLIVGGA